MNRKQAERRLEQLIKLGIIEKNGHLIHFTKKYLDLRLKLGEDIVNSKNGTTLMHFIYEHPDMSEEDVAKQMLMQASIMAILEMSGGTLLKQELVELEVVCSRITDSLTSQMKGNVS